MKFHNIKITNFKGIESLEHTFKNKTTVLLGKNGKGKTSFKEALYAVITGSFPSNAIKSGKTFTTVEVSLESGEQFSRTLDEMKPTKVCLNGHTTTGKSLNEMLENATGVNKETMKIVTSEEVIAGMTPGEFGDFIVKYIPEKLTYDIVISYMPGITNEAKEELKKLLPSMPNEFDVNVLREAYDHYFEARKATKKDILARQAKVGAFNRKEPTRNIDDVEADLAKVIGAEASQKAKEDTLKMYAAAVENRKKAVENLEKLQSEIDSLSAAKPNPSVLEKISKDIEAENKSIMDAKVMINTINDNICVFSETLINLGKPICPLSETLVCTTDKTKIKSEIEELIESNKEGLEIQEGIITKSNASLDKLRAEKKGYEEAQKLYDKRVLLNASYERQKKELPKLPVKPADEPVIVDFDEEKERFQRERDDIVAYTEHLKDVETLNKFNAKLAVYEQLCKALQPKGEVMSNIMSLYMSVFETAINSRASKLRPNFEIKFIPIDGVSYLVKTDAASEFKNFDSLSSGERTLTMFLILDMLNTLSGLKILVLDDLDKLDSTAFKELMNLVQSSEIQDSYDHIIVCTVDHKDTKETLDKYSGAIDII